MEESNELFVWVKASVELPPCVLDYSLRVDMMPFSGRYFDNEKGKYFHIAGITILYEKDFHRIEWAKPITKSDLLDELGEKEVMIQAFDSVRKLFEMRSWIMEGRGSYPYNDDRYKEEVRYLYDEFDDLQKKVWTNIKTKTFEYRERIIADYNAKLKPVEKVSDAEIIKMAEKFSNETFSDKSSFEFHTQYTSFLAGAKAIREILNKKGSEI